MADMRQVALRSVRALRTIVLCSAAGCASSQPQQTAEAVPLWKVIAGRIGRQQLKPDLMVRLFFAFLVGHVRCQARAFSRTGGSGLPRTAALRDCWAALAVRRCSSVTNCCRAIGFAKR